MTLSSVIAEKIRKIAGDWDNDFAFEGKGLQGRRRDQVRPCVPDRQLSTIRRACISLTSSWWRKLSGSLSRAC
jgi:hypothetical protein